ncbi:hypothetical protein DW786_05950 [Bacteroides uniformis]|nr:hypothetical protein DW786_05950 [Bacteroides uniformis]
MERIFGKDRIFNLAMPTRMPNTNYPQMREKYSDNVIALYVGEKKSQDELQWYYSLCTRK